MNLSIFPSKSVEFYLVPNELYYTDSNKLQLNDVL